MRRHSTSPLVPSSQRKYSSRFRPVLLGTAGAAALAALLAAPEPYSPLHYATTAAFGAPSDVGPHGFAGLVNHVKSAVVSVRVKIDEGGKVATGLPFRKGSPLYKFFFPNGQQPQQVIIGEGSGFFISADGYIVTNNHVADHAQSVQVTTDDGTLYTAKVVGTDERSDLALLKIDADKQFPFVKFADQRPSVGDWVVAVGNPFGLGGTVTAGIVSAEARDIGLNPYGDYLQIDAPINRGNSGGPAFNENGEVVGINTAIFSPSGGSVGIGFDIPADTAKRVIDQLKEKGYVTRAWIGVDVQPVTPAIAESLGMKKAEGTLVDQPEPHSPAADAGIQAGDIITEVDGQLIKDPRVLVQKISNDAPGTHVKLTVLHNKETKTVDVTLAEMPRHQETTASTQQNQNVPANKGESALGLSLAPAQDISGAGDKGVVVLGVDPGSPAADNGMQTGDVILMVSGKPVSRPADVRQAIEASRSEGKQAVLMRVQSQNGTRFIAIPIGRG
jgi:serine protease Do